MRYNSDVFPACAATSCCNAVGNMYLTSFAGLTNLHGRNELNEDDADENVSIGATIVCWANAGYIGGNPGSWIASALLDLNMGDRRIIDAHAPIYNEFNYSQRQRLLTFITGHHANEYGIIRCFVAEFVREDYAPNYVTTSPHFVSFFRIADTDNYTITAGDTNDDHVEWIFFGGERGSRPLRTKHSSVLDILCTIEGRLLLENGLSEPYGRDGRVTLIDPNNMANPTNLFEGNPAYAQVNARGEALLPDPSFIVLPKVQLRSRDVVPDQENVTTLKRNLPWTVINNTDENSHKMHTIQIINEVTVGQPYLAIRDLVPNAP